MTCLALAGKCGSRGASGLMTPGTGEGVAANPSRANSADSAIEPRPSWLCWRKWRRVRANFRLQISDFRLEDILRLSLHKHLIQIEQHVRDDCPRGQLCHVGFVRGRADRI